MKLEAWAAEWEVTFVADKTQVMVISRKKSPIVAIDVSDLRFKGEEVETVNELKLVGFVFDSKMIFEPMTKRTSAKGRAKIAALYRLKPFLDSSNLETMYNAFVRSSLEYGNLHYMVAAPTHLQKLDRIQATAERLGNFKVESLQARRESDASLIGLILKLLDGDGRGKLNDFEPPLEQVDPKRKGRHTLTGLQIKDKTNAKSLLGFERSISGHAHKVWQKLPQSLVLSKGDKKRQSITKNCQRVLTGKKVREEIIQNSHKKQSKQETKFEQNDQSVKYYTLAEKIGFKQSGILPLWFNEHTQILRAVDLLNCSSFSVDQSIKSIYKRLQKMAGTSHDGVLARFKEPPKYRVFQIGIWAGKENRYTYRYLGSKSSKLLFLVLATSKKNS